MTDRNLEPFWHGRMADRGTVFWCTDEGGMAVCYQTQDFWAMKYTERKDCEPRVLGKIVDNAVCPAMNGIYKDNNRILRRGRG